ncbi:MAG: NifB/NifX family molybdenum-iron cluster-binding protein, partial [Spirochaetales bacterium]|nr:NifB/NifX family molybdenum-iron cluster-binding protein [Spirochaetales bacterium]
RIFAVPTLNKKLTAHFGHCQSFAVLRVENDRIVEEDYLDPPEHQPGSYPAFLAGKGVNTIIAGGMGVMAQNLFKENNIEVFMGLDAEDPSNLVELYLQDKLENGDNLCDSNHDHGEGHHH